MNELAILRQDHTLELPSEIAVHFQPADRFIIWRDGDTLLLKRVASSPLDKAADLSVDDVLSLDEINEIVHEVRRTRPAK
ncbi:MAG: hypothetical protein KJ069_32220 [Anaerolineae bacterium]|nr:hypothetical protein [Anaerolineae bacterium]